MTKQAQIKTQNGEDEPFTSSTQTKSTPATNHQRAVRMLGYAFELGAPDIWLSTAQVLKARPTHSELASLSFVALMAEAV